MALHYIEFDSNSQALLDDLRTQILTSTDWARLTPDTVLLSTSANTNAGATSLPFAATGSDLSVGSIIMIDSGATREYRTITAMTATTITVAALTYAHLSGTPIRRGEEIYKATTTRGADMIIQLNGSHLAVNASVFDAIVWQDHDGLQGSGESRRYLHWRTNAGAASHPLHVTLSLGKEHFFLAIEGPRPGEAGALSTTYGSLKSYIFLCDVVPYDVGDAVPVVFAGGQSVNSSSASFAVSSHIGHVSRSLADTGSWSPGRLVSLEIPKGGFSDTTNWQRQREVDGQYVLAPYVVVHDDTGMRGRLSSFFFAGFNQPDGSIEVPGPPQGSKIEYQGQWYKLIAVNKSDAGRSVWAQLGAAGQSNGTIFQRSPIVAVPCLP